MATPFRSSRKNTAPSLAIAEGRGSIAATHTPASRAASARFEEFLKSALHHRPEVMQSPALAVAVSAICFDAIPDRVSLLRYLSGMAARLTFQGAQYVSWEIDGYIHRRRLSALTLLAAQKLDLSSVKWEVVLSELDRKLAQDYVFAKSLAIEDRIDAVLADGLCYWHDRLPRPLVFHLTKVNPMCALSDSVWQRRSGVRAGARTCEPSRDAQDEIGAAVVDALYQGRQPLSGAWFVDRLRGICEDLMTAGIRRSSAGVKDQLVNRLNSLAAQLEDAGPIEALLLDWALDILEFGSAKKEDPSIKTIYLYLNAAARPLYAAMSRLKQHPFSISAAEWRTIYENLLITDQDPVLLPALASFHRFLVRAHDFEPIPHVFRTATGVRAPRANMLWPHEIEGLPAAITHHLDDDRAIAQTTVLAELLLATGLRFGEATRLELGSITLGEGNSLRIHVAARPGEPNLKTGAARRIVEVVDQKLSAVIRPWIERRYREAASSSEFLFQDPHHPDRVYQLGKCYRALSLALKQVSGDDELTVHATRHTYVSLEVERILGDQSGDFSEINPLQTLRVRVGHTDSRTTLATYAHLYEDALRDAQDRDLMKLRLRTEDVARWTGTSGACLRQRKRRHPDWTPWEALMQSASLPPPVLTEPTNSPTVIYPPPKQIDIESVLKIAEDWSAGLASDGIALRCGLAPPVVREIIEQLEYGCGLVRSRRRKSGGAHLSHVQWFVEKASISRLDTPRWMSVVSAIDRAVASRPTLEVESWLTACRGSGIDGTHRATAPLLHLFKDAEYGADMFVLRGSQNDLFQAAALTFAGVFGVDAQAELVPSRDGRPEAYIQVLTRPANGRRTVASACCDMRTLRGLLICVRAYQRKRIEMGESDEG